MRLATKNQLFPHRCQISDMRLTGFSPSTVRYHCIECGGSLALEVRRDQWESVFGEGDSKSLRLTEEVLDRVQHGYHESRSIEEEELKPQVTAVESQTPEQEKWSPTIES